MAIGYSVLKHPGMYSKKRVEQALRRQQRKNKSKQATTIEKLFASVEAKPNGASIKDSGRSDTLYFDRTDNEYRMGSLKINMFDPDNAAEIVRRFNSGDA